MCRLNWFIIQKGKNETDREEVYWKNIIHFPVIVKDDGSEYSKLGLRQELGEDIEAIVCESIVVLPDNTIQILNSSAIIEERQIFFSTLPVEEHEEEEDVDVIKVPGDWFITFVVLSSWSAVFTVILLSLFCAKLFQRYGRKLRKGKKTSFG